MDKTMEKSYSPDKGILNYSVLPFSWLKGMPGFRGSSDSEAALVLSHIIFRYTKEQIPHGNGTATAVVDIKQPPKSISYESIADYLNMQIKAVRCAVNRLVKNKFLHERKGTTSNDVFLVPNLDEIQKITNREAE